MTDRTPDAPDMREKCVSQSPAIHLLTGLGWTLLLKEAESYQLHPLQPAAMRGDGATGLKKQIPAMGLVK